MLFFKTFPLALFIFVAQIVWLLYRRFNDPWHHTLLFIYLFMSLMFIYFCIILAGYLIHILAYDPLECNMRLLWLYTLWVSTYKYILKLYTFIDETKIMLLVLLGKTNVLKITEIIYIKNNLKNRSKVFYYVCYLLWSKIKLFVEFLFEFKEKNMHYHNRGKIFIHKSICIYFPENVLCFLYL